MDSFKDSVNFWVTIIGTVLGVFGVIQSLTWLAVIGILVASGSVGALIYARKQRLRLKSAGLTISGRSIDSLNVASLRRRTNRNLVIQETESVAVIDGEDLSMSWRSSGYCRAKRETVMECSIDTDTNIPFDDLDCFAYDLQSDPKRRHRIRPILLGPDGNSKKIAVPFLAPLSAQEPFRMALECKLPGCMKAGVDYYTATLSFNQDLIERYSMHLTFRHDLPQWVRAYECRADGNVRLLNDLRAVHRSDGAREYVDVDTQVSARSARIYVFFRRALTARESLEVDADAA